MITEQEKNEIGAIYAERDRVVAKIRADGRLLSAVRAAAEQCCNERDWNLGAAIRHLAERMGKSYQIAEVFINEAFAA